MDLGISGKHALITAAGRGIGAGVAQALAAEGVCITLVSRTKPDLDSLVNGLASKTDKHVAIPMDLAEQGASAELYAMLEDRGRLPSIVVHNLGGNLGITDPLCSVDEWRQVMAFNVEVALEFNRLIIPEMQRKKWGRICHISSISALENQGPPAYCAAKAALTAYTRSLGRYVAADGVIVTSVLPGAVFTDGGYWDEAVKNRPDHVERYLTERMAIKRFGTVDEISGVVAFLCSERASFCVGSSFLVDGGQGRVFQVCE